MTPVSMSAFIALMEAVQGTEIMLCSTSSDMGMRWL
jgi:hypothetical protein